MTAEESTAEVAPSTEAPKTEATRGEVSAATIARLMGLATQSDLKLFEGKLDLISSRLMTLGVKLDKISGTLNSVATANDLERLDVHVGSMRNAIREMIVVLKTTVGGKADMGTAEAELDKVPNVGQE